MTEYIDLNEAIIDFGFEWDDIAPTRDEFINFLKSRKRANVKRNYIRSLDLQVRLRRDRMFTLSQKS